MGLFTNFPYTNNHELNLDWVLEKIGLVDSSVESVAASAAAAESASTEAASSATSAAESADIAKTFATRGRRYIFLGDSYADGWNPEGGPNIDSWVDYIKSYLGLNDYSYYTSHAGGTGFTVTGQTGYTFAGLLTQLAPSVEDAGGITDIVVLGGYNDRNNSGSIRSTINSFRATAKNLFPNATVRVGWIGRNVSATKTSDTVNALFSSSQEYVKADISYLHGIENAARRIDQFFNDGVHPNETGQQDIAVALMQCLTGGAASVMTSLSGLSLSGGEIKLGANCQQIDGMLVFFAPTRSYPLSGKSGTCNGDIKIDCGEIGYGAFLSAPYNAGFTINGMITSGGNTYPANVIVQVDEKNHLILAPYARNSDGNGWATNPTAIQLFTTTVIQPVFWH